MKLPLIPLLGKKKTEKVDNKTAGIGEVNSGQKLAEGMINVKDIIAPSAIEVNFSDIKIGNTYHQL